MFKIICDYCGEDIQFSEIEKKPSICPNDYCKESLENLEIQEISTQEHEIEENSKDYLNGLVLIFQKTGEEIRLGNFEKVILGRENFGMEVLGKIKQISRVHCSIEFKNNMYIINDLGSMHGTYSGINKIDCKKNPNQTLKDNDLIFLGKEPFLVKFILRSEQEGIIHEIKDEKEPEVVESRPAKIIKYRCRECGTEFDEKYDKCPIDGSYGTMEMIEK